MKHWEILRRYFPIVLVDIAANETHPTIFLEVPKLMNGVLLAGFGKLPKINRIGENRLLLASWNQSSLTKSVGHCRHSRENGNPAVLRSPGFRLALATASLAGMTVEICCEFRKHYSSPFGLQSHPGLVLPLRFHGNSDRALKPLKKIL